jgi:hypothetical protein
VIAALEAGDIPVTAEMVTALHAGLEQIGHAYRIEKTRTAAPSDAALRGTLLDLYGSLLRTADIISADLEGAAQIGAMLSAGPWHHDRLRQYLDDTRGLLADLGPFCHALANKLAAQPRTVRHDQHLPTQFMVAIHGLYCGLRGRSGIGGPLHRFTRACAALVDPNLDIPQAEDSFCARLRAALKRNLKNQP